MEPEMTTTATKLPEAVKGFMDLIVSMRERKPVTMKLGAPRFLKVSGIVNAIEAEDGSGRSWNVTLSTSGGPLVVYWRE
jgi:hypothetical protein